LTKIYEVSYLPVSSQTNIIDFWLDQAGRFPLLPKAEVLRLAKIIQNPKSSKAARERSIQKLMRHNLKLVPGIAKRMTGSMKSFRHGDHCLADLFQVGAIGLRRAAEKFDPQRGYTFSTYAVSWIKQAIYREAYGMISPIRVPESTLRDYYEHEKSKEAGDAPVLTARKRDRLEDAFFAMNCISIDVPHNNDEESDFHQLIASKVYKVAKPRMTFDQIISKASLSDFQKKILYMKYMENYSASQIAEETGDRVSKVRDHLKRSFKVIRREGMYNEEVNPLLG